jgi:Leucine-rich repeat (LRR) protein
MMDLFQILLSISTCEITRRLTALTGLYLNDNQLKSVPAALGALTALTAGAYTRPDLSST